MVGLGPIDGFDDYDLLKLHIDENIDKPVSKKPNNILLEVLSDKSTEINSDLLVGLVYKVLPKSKKKD